MIAITGSDIQTVILMYDVLAARGLEPWVIWNCTENPVAPQKLRDAIAKEKLLTYRAVVYAAECQILTLRRIMDYTNADHVWTLDADLVMVKDVPPFDNPSDNDVLLGLGFSRFSRKALEHIARDFGSGLDYSDLSVSTI